MERRKGEREREKGEGRDGKEGKGVCEVMMRVMCTLHVSFTCT